MRWNQWNEICSFIDVLINIQPKVVIDNVYNPFMFASTWPKQATQSNTSRNIEILCSLGMTLSWLTCINVTMNVAIHCNATPNEHYPLTS